MPSTDIVFLEEKHAKQLRRAQKIVEEIKALQSTLCTLLLYALDSKYESDLLDGPRVIQQHAERIREAVTGKPRRKLPEGLEWQAILDALDFAEKECGGFTSDAGIRAKKKVEALIETE